MRALCTQDDGIKSDSLEVTQELLSRYGGLMPVEQHEVLQDALLPMLDEQRGALRKRAINVIGAAHTLVRNLHAERAAARCRCRWIALGRWENTAGFVGVSSALMSTAMSVCTSRSPNPVACRIRLNGRDTTEAGP